MSPPELALEPGPLPALAHGALTFACFQSNFKISDAALAMWSRILSALPGATLRIQNRQMGGAGERSSMAARLNRAGIDPSRVSLVGPVSRQDYLAAYRSVDIVLDTFPYTGGTTTCEALWMGVPTLSLVTPGMLGRQGASMLAAAGLHDWVVAQPEQYVATAIAQAAALEQLAQLRARLREQVLASPLFDGARFARAFESAMQAMWSEQRRA